MDQHTQSTNSFDTKLLENIFSLLRSHTGHDFSQYKRNTLCRRVERRMTIRQITSLEHYCHLLASTPEEVKLLSKELLIGVTNFFRDSAAFEFLSESVIPLLLHSKPEDACFRVWVPACSTGEEAYSIAIILQECFQKMGAHQDFQIFASDIDEDAIGKARTGCYPSDIAKDISAPRLQNFFTKIGNHYRIQTDLREKIIFAPQSVIKDPPFTRIDLLSCRNLLIYLGSKLQRKLLPLFHYSLNPGGVLFLGASESIGTFTNYFTVLDMKYKMYQRKPYETFHSGKAKFPITQGNQSVSKKEHQDLPSDLPAKLNISDQLQKLLIEQCLSPCIITDEKGEIIYVHGSTGNYVEPASGTASLNIIDMARPGIGVKLSHALREINNTKQPIIYRHLSLSETNTHPFNLIVKLIHEPNSTRPLVAIIFEPVNDTELEASNTTHKNSIAIPDERLVELERELKYTKENLQSTIEELKSTNEELQSTNEELQSTNEELETSKEELVTVNVELESRIAELSNTNNDIKNLLDSTNIATIFLDKALNVKRFTPKTKEIIRLIPTDIGRPIQDMVIRLKNKNLIDDVNKVINTQKTIENEVQSHDESWYYMRITPYQTAAEVTDGVVLTFEDITEIKKHREKLEQLVAERTTKIEITNRQLRDEVSRHKETAEALRKSDTRFRLLFESNIIGIFFVDKSGLVTEMNQAFFNMIGYDTSDLPLAQQQITHSEWRKHDKKHYQELIQKGYTAVHETAYIHKDKHGVSVLQAGILLDKTKWQTAFFVMDMTAYKHVQDQLQQRNAKYAHTTRINSMGEMATGIAHELNQPLANITNYINGLQLRLTEGQLDQSQLLTMFDKISAEAKRSSSILRKMRDLVKKQDINISPVDLKKLILDIIERYELDCTKEHIHLKNTLLDTLPPLMIDAIQIEQVIVNLLNNAIDSLKMIPKQQRNIYVQTKITNNAMIEITVRDSGKPLPKEIANKIFDMFYTTKKSGLGMGLTISRTIIESYGGYLNYISDSPNNDNIFKILLPTNQGDQHA